ncbi:MAG TPA: AAA family ATPase [Candidatus Saccharimonadales bacterium]|nr:AAA family ATPase [Candidatus Saccharimonadales bacterium]
MFEALVLHAATRRQAVHFAARPSHALLLSGPDGIGKATLAEALIAAALGTTPNALGSYPHFKRITRLQGTSISIEAIRDLQHFLQLKTIGTAPYRRAVLIEHAQDLTTEAQNAYLKLLEEPPADTIMLLTVNSPRALLPTIVSRAQHIALQTPTEADLRPLLDASGKDAATQRQAYFLSGGLPGLLAALLADDQAHPLLASVATAKEILQKQPFERLCLVDSLSKQKEQTTAVLEALERIASAGLNGASAKGNTAQLTQWHRIRKQIVAARQALAASANTKLTVSNLFLHL